MKLILFWWKLWFSPIFFKKEITTIFKELLINEQIVAEEVRLISANGEQLGVVKLSEANAIAEREGLDLVLISPNANPMVCKIMDYGKYKFDTIKKEKEIKKSQKIIEVKEIQLSMTISDYDISYRVNNAIKFLKDGDKVKVALRMKGRQLAYKDACMTVVNNFVQKLAEHGTTEKAPELNGKTISVVVSPIKK